MLATLISPDTPVSKLDPFHDQIVERVQKGLTTTRTLCEISALGYTGGRKRDEQLRAEFRAMMEADEMAVEELVSSHEPLPPEAWDDMDLPF